MGAGTINAAGRAGRTRSYSDSDVSTGGSASPATPVAAEIDYVGQDMPGYDLEAAGFPDQPSSPRVNPANDGWLEETGEMLAALMACAACAVAYFATCQK